MFLKYFSADIYFLWAVDMRNKKKKKNMEKQADFECSISHLNSFPLGLTLLYQSLKL